MSQFSLSNILASAEGAYRKTIAIRAQARNTEAANITEFSSSTYWESRYKNGGNSGAGSRGLLAHFKASVINNFTQAKNINHVIELGCGDGYQLSLASYHSYLGLDISPKAIELCQRRFRSDKSKSFKNISQYNGETGDLSLSLDVIFHLTEESVFNNYMNTLFRSSTRYVCIYSSNIDDNDGISSKHVRHRRFTDWIAENAKEWQLIKHVLNPFPFQIGVAAGSSSFSNFYFYSKESAEKPAKRPLPS